MSLKDYRRLFENVPVPKVGGRPVGAQPVVPIEPMKGPWSGNQNLGSSKVWDSSLIGNQTIFKLPEWGMPKIWTLSLGIDPVSEWNALSSFDMTATIFFGAGGTSQTIEMDWVNGSSIILPGNAFEVLARLYSDANTPAVAPDNIRLSVTASQGSLGTPSASRTFKYAVANGGNTTPKRIPNFAKYMIVLNASNTGVGQTSAFDATVRYEVIPGTAGGTVFQMYGDMLYNVGGVMPIPAMGRYIRIWNASAAICYPVVVFGLAY